VSGGGTAAMAQAHTHRELTEHRAGEYVFGDRRHLLAGRMSLETIAASVVTTVVSRPTPERGILDAGSKTLTSDLLGLDGHGLIVEYPDARIYGLSEEHGHVDFSQCARRPDIGERVTVIPNHCCVVTNLFNQAHAVRNGQVEVVWPVAARGAVQ
jgi:D-serine deaminase-like pyridoxal phosphate-dependent protein